MSPLEPVTFCPKCGTRSEGGRFCRSCGTNLAAISSAISRPQSGSPVGSQSSSAPIFAVFNSVTASNENWGIEGHSACAIFGNVTIDLTAGPLPTGETRINVYSVFGSSEILVPDDVGIRVTGVSIFADAKVLGQKVRSGFLDTSEYVSPDYYQATRRLHVDASAVFGEVKIRR